MSNYLQGGCKTPIDLRIINEDFVGEEASGEDSSHNYTKDVLLFLHAEGNYGKVKLKLLKFVLADKDSDCDVKSVKQMHSTEDLGLESRVNDSD